MSRLLTVCATAASTRILTIILAVISKAFVDDYDSSAETILLGSSTALIPNNLLYRFFSVFVRWDAFYFLHIAENGYVYEQEHAFFPLLPMLSRLVSETGTNASVLQLANFYISLLIYYLHSFESIQVSHRRPIYPCTIRCTHF